MDYRIMQTLGLSLNEGKIYESLVEQGESSITDVALSAKIHRRNAYDAINRLMNKGLAFQIISSGERRYNAVDPDKLTELFAERQTALENILPNLKRKFQARVAPEEAYIYRGVEGQKNVWRDVIRVGKDSYFIGAKGGWFDPRLYGSHATEKFFKEANRKKIKFIQLFDHEMKTLSDFPKYFPGKLEYRFLPKEYSTDSAIHIFGDYVVTYTGMTIKKLADDVVFFVIRSKNLAQSYRTWFWYMWKQSKN